MYRYLSAALLALLPSVALAQRDAKIPDPDPELERKTFVVAPGFEVSLYAADPLLAKPIQMNFDPQGRLWVASSEVYPQIKPGETANDKIIILEDTNNDGKADKTTVFADGLLIPTGVEPGDGGAYVANSTELVHLSASKPGGKADRKRILLSGFGTEDTHHIIHTFRWGPDCNLYFNQSIYIHSHIETPHGVKRLNAGGIWKFRPETSELDVFARGWVNAWGHAFDKYGQSFVTDGAGGEGINHVVPGGYYLTSQGPHAGRVLHGLNPGSPKHCGLEIISGRHFPDDWQGDCITNDFRGHRVCRFKLQDDGSTFASREQTEVIKSTHPAFRPIDVKMGPDGALYIADWYNPIIQHGEVDFRDPRRDKTHGRIWRVTAKGRPLVPKPKLVDATIPELLERLKDPEDWTRQQAKRVLKERGREKVLPEVHKWVKKLDHKDGSNSGCVMEALWVYESLGEFPSRESVFNRLPPGVIGDFFIHQDSWSLLFKQISKSYTRVKPALVRLGGTVDLLGMTERHAFKESMEQWEELVRDPYPRVRLEAVRALATAKTSGAVETALRALDYPMDRVLDYALWLTVRELEPYWMPEFKAGKLTFGGDPKKIAFALNAVGSADAVKPLVALIDSGTVPKENLHGLYVLLARIGGPAELGKVTARAGVEGVAPADRVVLLDAVEESVRTRKVGRPAGDLNLSTLVNEIASGTRPENRPAARTACRLIGLWKDAAGRPAVEAVARSEKDVDPADRAAALEGVALFGDAPARTLLSQLCEPNRKAEVRQAAVIALSGIDAPAAAAKAVELLTAAEAKNTLVELYGTFLTRRGGAATLAKALAGKTLNPDVAKLGLRAVRAAAAKDSGPLADALTKAGGLGAAKKEATPEEVKARVADVAALGDAARGEAVFRRKEIQCLACHGTGGAGGQVGPDLTSIGASAPVDYVVESLLLPNKAVKEGYHTVRIETAAGQVLQGIKVREANGQFVLRTPEDKEVVIPKADIVEQGAAKSLMPEGLTDSLTRQEFADLARFLSELGKVGGPYAPSKARVVRRWQVIDATPENLNIARRTRLTAAAEPTNGFVWSPLYARASGDLPLGDLPKIVVWANTDPLAVVRFQLDVTTGGPVKLRFNSPAGLTAYLGTVPVEVKAETVFEAQPGVQTVTLVVDRTKRTDDLRVELDDVAGSPARASVVGGK